MSEIKNIPRLRFERFHQDWNLLTIGDSFEIVGGGTPSTTNSEYWDGDINWFTPTEIKGREVTSSIRKITSKGLQNSSAKILPVNTLLFTSRATIGEMSFNTQECTTNQGFQSILPSTENDNRFLYYWSSLNKRVFIRKATGSTFLEISKKTLEKIHLSIPSLPEQQKIADFLTAVDKRIELLEKKKTLLETYKKGVMKKIFNQEIRFKDDNGNDFPDWEEKRLGDVVNLKHGYQFRRTDFTEKGLPIIKIGNVKGSGLFLEDLSFIDANRYDEFKSFEILNGDILMSLTGNIGRVIEVKNLPYKVIQNYRVGNFQPFSENEISKKFLKHLLETDQVFGRFNSLSNQSAQANFGKQDMDKIRVGIPYINEQEKISKFLLSIDSQIELLETQIDKSKTWKKGLLQKMFV